MCPRAVWQNQHEVYSLQDCAIWNAFHFLDSSEILYAERRNSVVCI